MNRDDPILKKCRAILSSLHGERLKGIVLYGSLARGTEREDSDIDLLVLLEGPVDAGLEIRRVCEAVYPVQLESDRLICLMPAEAEAYRKGSYMFYRSAQENGVAV